jgi:hypothetical protein
MLPEQRLRDMFSSNPDGAGFMFTRDKQVHIRKGFMKFKHFLRALNDEGITKSDILIMHFRIATAGSVSPQNTHPFPVSTNLKDLRATSTSTDMAMAHNGIISYAHDTKNDLSDTMTFIREVLAEKHIKDNIYETSVLSLVEMAVGTSRLVFMDGEGQFSLIGDWMEDKIANDGCFYSNLAFRWKSAQASSGTWYEHRSHKDYGSGVHVVTPMLPAATAAEKEQVASVKGEFSNTVPIYASDTSCPKCKAAIHAGQAWCHKCAIMFERED